MGKVRRAYLSPAAATSLSAARPVAAVAATRRVLGRVMCVKDDEKGSKPMKPGRERGRSPTDAGFDRWLDKQLHAWYEPVLHEGIPESLSEILEKFDSRARGKPDKSQT